MKSKKFTFCAMLCISMLLSITAAYAQVEEKKGLPDDVFPGDPVKVLKNVLYKPGNMMDRGILFMDVGELIGNSRTYGYWQSNQFPFMVHGYWGEIYRMFPMVGMPPGPWGADIPTSEFGSVDRSMNYNVLELVQHICISGYPLGIEYSDWEAKDFNLERAMGGYDGGRSSAGIPLIAIRTQEDTWPEGYYGAEDKFAGSGVWTDTPGERHWPGRWAGETDPASPDYGKPVYGKFASAKDAYYSEYDKYAGIRPGDDINTSYPVGLDMETSVYCYASPLYEDIIYWDVDLIFMEEDWVRAPNGDVTMGDPYRHIYTGTIDSMYFGIYLWTCFPDYRRESSRYYARPYGQDTMAWFEAPDALFFYFKYGWHQRQWGTPYSGPVSIYSLYFPKTPYDLGITAFHWFEERDIDNYAPGQNWEARLYAMMSGQPEILHDNTGYEKNLLFHPYPEAGEEPNYKVDNIDSLIHWHDYREDGTLRPNTLDCTGYGIRTYANFMIGTGPFSMSPGDTMEITFCMFGSDDNPGPLSPGSADDRQMEYDRWPLNDPLKFSVDPHDRFYDVYLNLDEAENLKNSFFEDPYWSFEIDSLSSDSLIIIILYRDLHGSNWNNNTNWLSNEPVSSWYGITTNDSGNVTRIDLTGNDLSGTLPPEIWNLVNLESLYLHTNKLTGSIPSELGNLVNLQRLMLYDNQFTGSIPPEIVSMVNLDSMLLYNNKFTDLPDITALDISLSVRVYDNKLTFEDIEPNVGHFGEFLYAPQDSVGSQKDTTVSLGSSFTLSVSVGGTANQYQWMKDGADITGSLDSTLSISPVQLTDAGDYICKITNTIATDLTLYIRPITVHVYTTETVIVTEPEIVNVIKLPTDSSTVTVNFTNKSSLSINFTSWNVANNFLTITQYSDISSSFPNVPVFNNAIFYYDIALDVDQFEAELTFGYTDSLLAVLGIDEDSLAVNYYDSTDTRGYIWHSIPCVINKITNAITVTVSHFSLWAVTGKEEPLITHITEQKNQYPDDFKLFSNYPNPFNPETLIKFQITRVSFVKLKIYNVNGSLVKTLVSENMPAGVHSFVWDGTNESGKQVSSGMYIYHLQAGEFSAVKKMLFIK